MENGDRIKIHERITGLEVKVDQILTNHLPHIYSRINWILGVLVTGLVSIILLLIQ